MNTTHPPGDAPAKQAPGQQQQPGKPGQDDNQPGRVPSEVPGKPNQPGQPGEPGQPGQPGDPRQPHNPDQPRRPGDPGRPDVNALH